jgi:hypothetical protein
MSRFPSDRFPSGEGFQSVQNRVSIFLSQARRSIAVAEFETLLRVRRAADEWHLRSRVTRRIETEWGRAVGRLLDRSFAELEKGILSRRAAAELIHLYRDLMMDGPDTEPVIPVVTTSRTPRFR